MDLFTFFVIFMIVSLLIIAVCVYGIWSTIYEWWITIRPIRKKKIKLNPQYAESIKCKYCAHFNPRTNRCHLYSQFDSSLDQGNDAPYYKDTNPDDRCDKFMLPAMEVVMCMGGAGLTQRGDGSYIVSLEDASM